MLNEFFLGPEQLVDVGGEGQSGRFRVLPDRSGIGDAPSAAEFDVDISPGVNTLVEANAEDSGPVDELWLGAIGIVFTCTATSPATRRPAVFLLIGLPKLAMAKALPSVVASHQM